MKYETALHQNLAVWARRAQLDLTGIDLDDLVKFTEQQLGNGRRGALRCVVIESLRASELLRGKQFTSWVLGLAIADMTYDVVYGGKSPECISEESLRHILGGYETTGDASSRGMRYGAQALAVVRALVDARTSEKRNGNNVIAAVLRKVRS